MFEFAVAEVVEALPGHGGVFDFLFFGEETEHCVHEGGFSGGGGGLDDDGKGFVEFAGGAGEVGGERVVVSPIMPDCW